MRRPGAMRFHAALRASHSSRSVGDVQFIQVTHDESLALTLRETVELLPNDIKDLRSLKLLPGILAGVRDVFQGVRFVLPVAPGRERGNQRRPKRAHPAAAEVIPDGVLHDAVK